MNITCKIYMYIYMCVLMDGWKRIPMPENIESLYAIKRQESVTSDMSQPIGISGGRF